MADPLYAPDPSGVSPSGHGLLDRLLHILLPAPCLGCGEPLPARAALGLCTRCRARLRPLARHGCAVCSRPLPVQSPPVGYRCGTCRTRPPGFDRLLGLWSYEPPLDAVVQALKFRRLDYLGRHLAEALERDLGPHLGEAEILVPVPLHWRRKLVRGYNQAERIARPLASALRLPLSTVLVRSRATPPQSLLGRSDRLANLRRAFHVSRPQAVSSRHVLLVDDVATTGATLDAAASALKAAGAAAVTAVVVARTPLAD